MGKICITYIYITYARYSEQECPRYWGEDRDRRRLAGEGEERGWVRRSIRGDQLGTEVPFSGHRPLLGVAGREAEEPMPRMRSEPP